MRVAINCFLILMLVVTACSSDRKNGSNMVRDAQSPVKTGEFLKMEQIQSYNGKVLMSTSGRMPAYQSYDTLSMIPEAYRAFTGVKIGDTVSYEVVVDSNISIGGQRLNLNGGKIKVSSKILNILPDQESLLADMDVTKRKLQAAQDK